MDRKNRVTNTTRTPRFDWVLGGNPGAIEAQEAHGQEEFVQSEVLPRKLSSFGRDDVANRALMESWGVVFGEPVPDDDLFQYVTLPAGWKRERTDHSMWSKLVDGQGRERASIFYKAAFYDRDAFLNITAQD